MILGFTTNTNLSCIPLFPQEKGCRSCKMKLKWNFQVELSNISNYNNKKKGWWVHLKSKWCMKESWANMDSQDSPPPILEKCITFFSIMYFVAPCEGSHQIDNSMCEFQFWPSYDSQCFLSSQLSHFLFKFNVLNVFVLKVMNNFFQCYIKLFKKSSNLIFQNII